MSKVENMNKVEMFMEYLQNCKKHKGKLQSIMAKKDVALFVRSYHDIMNMIKDDPEFLESLTKDFKMSKYAVQETLFMGRFLENLTDVAKKEFEKQQREPTKH